MGLLDNIFRVDNKMKKQLKIGDWVNSYSKGIYRIENIIVQYFDESSPLLGENKVGDKIEDRIIVSKRLLNSKYKKSIGYDSCSEYFISHLDSSQNSELQKVLKDNPQILIELDNYKIPTRTTIYNSDLQIDNENDLMKVNQLIDFIKNGKSFLQIEKEMKRLDIFKLKPKHFGNYNFQFFNYDDECQDKRRIWRDAILTKKIK